MPHDKFNVGDLVRCVDAEGTDLINGGLYVIKHVYEDMAMVLVGQYEYWIGRFVALPQMRREDLTPWDRYED